MAESVGDQVEPVRRLVGWRRWAARAALVVLAPALVLLLIEGALRLAGYGIPTTFFIPSADRRLLLLNDRFSHQFAPKEIAPAGHALRLAATKKPGTFRIFILGESAAMGTPEPAFGFGRILREMLREQYPGTEFEVVNCAMTAINSHIVLPIARETARKDGDLYIIYMGNNEVTGPFGPLTIYKQFTPSLRLIRSSIWAKRTRTGQWIASLLGGQKPAISEWKGMENWANNRVAHDDPRREGVYAHYKANLEAILDAVTGRGAPAIVCTMAINLKDCPPFASLHKQGLTPEQLAEWERHYAAGAAADAKPNAKEALAHYRKAFEIDAEYAELRYRMGQCLFATGDAAAAMEHYSAARDLDALQFRTDSRLQAIIRQTAGAYASKRVRLADVEAAFAGSSLAEKGIPGKALLWEHVHMTFEGNCLIAQTLLPLVAGAMPEAVRKSATSQPPDAQRLAERLCFTPFDRARCVQSIHGMMARPPFTGQIGHAQRLAELVAESRKLDLSAQTLEHSIALYDEALKRDPDDWELHFNYASLLGDAGKAHAAQAHLDTVARLVPGYEEKLREARAKLLLQEGKADEAIAAFEELIRTRGDSAGFRLNLGFAQILKGKPEDAEKALREALRMKPDMTSAMNALGSALLAKDDLAGAEVEFRRALAVIEEPDTHMNLATVLRRQGKRDEAARQLRRAAELNRYSATPRFKMATLLLESQNPSAAFMELKATVALDPKHGQAHALLAQMLMSQQPLPTEEAMNHMRGAVEAGGAQLDLISAYSWYLAAHPNASLRDADRALKLAEEACARAQNQSPLALRSLAAAQAEKGRFDEARKTAKQAHDLAVKANQAGLAKAIAANIAAYDSRRKAYEWR